MKKTSSFFLLLGLPILFCQAQSISPHVLSACGQELSAGGFQLSGTLGQIGIDTLTGFMTKGFQQGSRTLVAVKGKKAPQAFRIFPNPSSDRISIEPLTRPFYYSLHSADGKKLLSGKTQLKKVETLDVKGYPTGSYLLHLDQSVFQIIKN